MDHSLLPPRLVISAADDNGRRVGVVAAGRVWLVLLAGLVLVAGGCSSPDGDAGEPGAPTPTRTVSGPTPTPTEPVQTTEQAVLAAFEGMWAAYDQAGRAPAADPDHPQLAEHAAEDALEGLRSALGRLRDEGLVFEGSNVSLSPTVVELSPADEPTSAKVEDCQDGSGWVVVRADGGEYEDEPGGRRAIFADVELSDDGQWRVTSFAVREVGSC